MFDCDELSSSKSDDSVPTSPVNDRYKSSKGYHAVPPPYTGTFMPPKLDLVFHDAPTVSKTTLNVFNVETSTTKPTKDMSQSHRPSAPIIEDWVFDSKDESEVLTRSRLVPFNAVRPVTTAVSPPTVNSPKPVKHVITKAHLLIRRPINHRPAPKNSNFHQKVTTVMAKKGNPQQALKDKGGKITSKGKIKTGKLDFDDVYFVKELKFNLFSVSQMCDKKNSVLFTYTKCVVLSSNFKLPDENHVLLRVPIENNMYNVDLKNVVPLGDLTCLFAKATLDESILWHRKLGHINFKTMNTLVKGNLVSGLPSKVFENNHTCVSCKKGKQHRASYSLLPIPFWAEAVNTARYVQNRVLVTKPHNKTPYELLLSRSPSIGFMRPFRCPVTILNTLDPLEKFDRNADEGFLVGYSVNSKAFRSMNYQPVVAGNQPNHNVGIQENLDVDANATFDVKENENEVHVSPSSSDKPKKYDEKAKRKAKGKSHIDLSTGVRDLRDEFKEFSIINTNRVNAASAPAPAVGLNLTNSTNSFNAASPSDNAVSLKFEISGKCSFMDPSHYPDDLDMPALEDIIYSDDEEDVGAEADFSNLETNISVSPILTTRVHKDHPVSQIIGELTTAPQTRTRIEAIRLFLAYASFMGFMVYQMEVKSAFLYETIKEKVYVCQPLGFEDPDYPDKVYVDDIIFGSTNKELCKAFEKLMKDKFQTSSMGELTFFLGLQVKQKEHRIFINQDKYVAKILRMFGLTDGKSASTPIDTEKPLLKDPDVKKIFRYLKGKPHLGLWYPKDSPFNLVAYSDSDYAGASLDRKSTTGGQTTTGKENSNSFMADSLPITILLTKLGVNTPRCDKDSFELMELKLYVNAVWFGERCCSLNAARKKVVVTEDTIHQDLRLDDADGVECLANEEIFAELARMGYEKPPPKLTFYKAFFSAQWKFLIHTIVQCMSVKRTACNEFSSFIASVVICLTTDRKFNFSKYILDNMIRNLDSPSKFLMYPSFRDYQAQAEGQEVRKEEEIKAFWFKELKWMLIFKERWKRMLLLSRKSMTMAQTLIKMKAEKARILDEQLAKRLQDEEIEQAAAREKQEKEDLERAKRKPISIAQAKKNIIVYLKNMAGYKMQHFKGMTYHQESFKKLREKVEVSCFHSTQQDTPIVDPIGMSEEDVQNMLQIIPMADFKVEALQVTYPLIDWETYCEGSRSYWKIIRVGGITQAYQSFEDMLKDFDREDLDALWRLVKERFSRVVPTVDKEKALWAELTRLYEPNADDVFWKHQNICTIQLYRNCILTVEYIKYL
nr:putative ribonuclease H-like domain-containing protein [Tanacetum cinerariifolium]